jgi:hypothetical protein
VFPGLRVITGEDAASVQPDQTVASLDLVMGDKSGNTDPMLINIADRIEAANPFVDIIEIRRDSEARVFSLNMLFVPPQTANTLQGQREQLDLMRRSIELGWRAILATSEGTDILRITLLGPGQLDTIDHGPSFVGVIRVVFEIDRSDAVTYLQGQRSLESFNNMVADGTIRYRQPQELELYTGSPNHPMSLSPAAGTP